MNLHQIMPVSTGTTWQSLIPCQQELVSSLLRPYERFQAIFKASLSHLAARGSHSRAAAMQEDLKSRSNLCLLLPSQTFLTGHQLLCHYTKLSTHNHKQEVKPAVHLVGPPEPPGHDEGPHTRTQQPLPTRPLPAAPRQVHAS